LGVPAHRVRSIPNGRDVRRLRERAAKLRGNSAEQQPPYVVSIGRLTHQKGFDLLIRAHAQLSDRRYRLRIFGEGPLRADLERLVSELGVSDSVELPGFATDVPSAVVPATLFCLPSRHEGQPLALIEALALGVPVVGADCSAGVRQLLGRNEYGQLVPAGSVDALAEALQGHLANPERLRAKAAAAAEHIDGYSTTTTASKYLEFFRTRVDDSRS
jgi:glycosyltransferase involved in cell wall biosynthesis